MNETKTCSRCGKPVARGDLMGLCPDCLLAVGLGTVADATAAGSVPRFSPPKIETLAPLFPRLDIEALLGCGGMGAVYRARQRNLDRVVALKILPPDIGSDPAFAARFAREAKALAKLNHPNIVTLYEFGQAGDLFYFLMEYVDGVNLRQVVQNERIAPREALAIVPQICDALQYAHDQGIVHRDIKPENILLDRRGRVKVADFGVAKLVRAADPSEQVDRSNRAADGDEISHASLVMGTPSYMAPEQRERPTEVDHRADIYSLGVVFYQMLTGELPGANVVPPSRKVVVDVRLDEIVLRALEQNPARRYQQASEVKTVCETLACSAPVAALSSESGGGFSERTRWLLLIRAVILCVAGMVVGLHLRPTSWGVATAAWGTLGAMLVGRLSLGPTSRLERNRTWVVVVSQVQAIGVCLAGTGVAFSGDIGLAMEWRAFVAGLSGVGVAVSVVRLLRVAWAGLARARLSGQAWRAPEAGWGWLVGKAFGITFSSRAAWTCANSSALGFLGALGFFGYLPFPGAYRCFGLFGLSGFFGLIGVAQLLEAAARRRLGGTEAVPRPVGLRAISLFLGSFVASVIALAVWGMAWHGKVEWTGTLVFGFVFAAATVGVRIRDQKRAAAVPAATVVGAARASLGWGERSRISYGVFFALYAGLLALLAASVDRLPEKVASHFGFNGLADGWMSRRSYLLVECGLLAAFAALLAGVPALVRVLPTYCINIPRKDYWLAPERRALTGCILRARMGWLLCLMTLFFAGLHMLTVQANHVSPSRLSMGGLLLLTMAFLIGLMMWVSWLLMSFAETGTVGPADGGGGAPAVRGERAKSHRWRKWMMQLLVGVAMAVAARVWLVGSYSIKNHSLSPEIPSGSCVLAWKPARTFWPGDLIVYRHEDRFMGGRVERSDAAGLVVNRNGVSGFPVAREAVCGRIVSVLWRGQSAEGRTP